MRLSLNNRIKGAIIASFLFLCSQAFAAPIIYFFKPGQVELNLYSESYYNGDFYYSQIFCIKTGISYNTAFLISTGITRHDDIYMKDMFFSFSHYLGGIKQFERLRWFFQIDFGLPTGVNSYLAQNIIPDDYGVSTVNLMLNTVYYGDKKIYVLSLNYIMLPAPDEDLYDGFYMNLSSPNVWKRLFGLNPFYNDNFLYYKKLFNDFLMAKLIITSSRFKPFILSLVLNFGDRIDNKRQIGENGKYLLVEGFAENIMLVSGVDVKYFFNELSYIGLKTRYNFIKTTEGINWLATLHISSLF